MYKVLWVDDDESIVEGYKQVADDYNIELDVAQSWEEAEGKLQLYFEEYSGIILDANCKLRVSDTTPDETFLWQAMQSLSSICGKRQKYIPWYILSAGTMQQFEFVVKGVDSKERKEKESEWGKVLYSKDSPDDKDLDSLFENIAKVGSQFGINTVLYRHGDVFKYVGEGKVFDYIEMRTYLLKLLSTLYYPENNLGYAYEGNPLRKIVEYIFRTANKYGLLPDECMKQDNQKGLNLIESNRFLSGIETKHCKPNLRFGEAPNKDKKIEGETIFSKEIGEITLSIINYGSSESHTDDEPYKIPEESKEIILGFAMLLCHVIKWFGKYIEEHPNVEENKSKIRTVEEKEEQTPPKTKTYRKAEKLKVEFRKDIPTKEEICNKSQYVLSSSTGTYAMVGAYCKIPSEYKKYVGQQVVVKQIANNNGDDADKIPYIATEVELIHK